MLVILSTISEAIVFLSASFIAFSTLHYFDVKSLFMFLFYEILATLFMLTTFYAFFTISFFIFLSK